MSEMTLDVAMKMLEEEYKCEMHIKDALHDYVLNVLHAYDAHRTRIEQAGPLKAAVHTITLCGSTKFKHYFIYANEILTMRGSVVISLAFFGHADKINLTREQKEFLDELHLKKIMKADEIFVLDVNGYVGDSTRKEIEFAEAHNKIITYYTQCEELRLEIDNKVREYLDAFDADAERVRRKKQGEYPRKEEEQMTDTVDPRILEMKEEMKNFTNDEDEKDMMVGPEEPFVLNDCSACRGHRWKVWKVVNRWGGTIPEIRSCPYCNPEGKRPAPTYKDEQVKEGQ